MRPHSEIRIDTAAALVDGGGTTRQLAQRTGWSIGLTSVVLDNMVRSGDVVKARSVRVPGVKRPVPFYERSRPADQVADEQPFLALMQAWCRPSAAVAPQRTSRTVAAM